MTRDQFKGLVSDLIWYANGNNTLRQRGMMNPILPKMTSYPTLKDTKGIKDIAKYDAKLAVLLEKVEGSHKEVDDYILSRSDIVKV